MVSVFAINDEILDPSSADAGTVLQPDREKRLAVGKDPAEPIFGIAANGTIFVARQAKKTSTPLVPKSPGTGEGVGVGPCTCLIRTKSNPPPVPTIEESLDLVLYAGRRLEGGFEVNIEKVVSVNTIVLK